jgi:uncharacterized protein YndB with AHSA1/START domain
VTDFPRAHELKLVRVFETSVAELYAAWTDPGLLRAWMGSRVEADARVGGAWRAENQMGETCFVAKGEFLVLEENRRVVMSFLAGPKEPVAGATPYRDEMIEITFRDLGDGRSELTLRNGWNGEGMDEDGVKGAKEGWTFWLDALGGMLESRTMSRDWRIDFERRMRENPDRVLMMTRRFEASPERVYDAWTDPKYASLWLFTGPTSDKHTCEMDPRPGGRWTVTDTRGGVLYTATGEFLEADRPRKVSLTFAMPQFSPEHDLITVTFEADGDGCIMRFRQEGIAQEAKEPSKSGWTPMFEGLAKAIGAPAPELL